MGKIFNSNAGDQDRLRFWGSGIFWGFWRTHTLFLVSVPNPKNREIKGGKQPGMVAHTPLIPREAKAGGLPRMQGQPRLHNEILAQNTKAKKVLKLEMFHNLELFKHHVTTPDTLISENCGLGL